MQRGGLLTGQGTWQNGSDGALTKIRNEARVISLITSTVAFYKSMSRRVK